MTLPTTVGTFPAQNTAPDAVFSLDVRPYFTDPDALATKSYSATGLPTGLSLNTSTGAITGTPTVAGTSTATVACTTSDGATNSFTISIVVADTTSAAQTYYVNGSTGNDSWDGTSATFTSGSTGPWRTITRANNVQPHASGNVEIHVAPGTYRNQTWTPQYSGTDNTHRIILRVGSDGIVDIMGPSSGRMLRGLQIGNDTTARNYISVVRDSATRYFRFDGEVVFGSGQASKGSDVTAYGHMDRFAYVNGVGITLECEVRRTVGYNGVEFGPSCDLYIDRVEWPDHHGSAYHSDGEDWGDNYRLDSNISPGS